MDILREENLIFQDFFFFFGGAGWRTEMELGKGRLSCMAANCSVSFGDELGILSRVRRRACCTAVHFTRNLLALPRGDRAVLSTGDVVCSIRMPSSAVGA